MRLLAFLAVALLLTVFNAQAQVYGPYDDYDDYGGYYYDDPYSPYPPPSPLLRGNTSISGTLA